MKILPASSENLTKVELRNAFDLNVFFRFILLKSDMVLNRWLSLEVSEFVLNRWLSYFFLCFLCFLFLLLDFFLFFDLRDFFLRR